MPVDGDWNLGNPGEPFRVVIVEVEQFADIDITQRLTRRTRKPPQFHPCRGGFPVLCFGKDLTRLSGDVNLY